MITTPKKNERETLVMPERSRQLFELQPARLFAEGGTRDCRDEEIELLDNEPEGDDRDPGPHPGEEGPFIGGVVAVSANHGGLSLRRAGSRRHRKPSMKLSRKNGWHQPDDGPRQNLRSILPSA
jgi:hypothetical protein